MSLPRVYGAIHAISSAFARQGLPKERINLDDGYAYRGVDEVVERLGPLLAEHKLCILPRVLERTQGERLDPFGEPLVHVALRVAFDLVSVEDGSVHTIEAIGEALDSSDKASAKAMTSAYKHGVLHAFCVPVSGQDDPDRNSPGLHITAARPAPVEGWAQWAKDIASVISSCATPEAIERLLASNRAQLASLAREQPDDYQRIGRAIAAQRKVLAQPVAVARDCGATAGKPASPRRGLAKPVLPKPASQEEVAAKPQPSRNARRAKPKPRAAPAPSQGVEAKVLEHG